jgi:hypothetical protein
VDESTSTRHENGARTDAEDLRMGLERIAKKRGWSMAPRFFGHGLDELLDRAHEAELAGDAELADKLLQEFFDGFSRMHGDPGETIAGEGPGGNTESSEPSGVAGLHRPILRGVQEGPES